MPAPDDLEVDTGWIRRGSATLAHSSSAFLSAPGGSAPPIVPADAVGGSAAVSTLLTLRAGQAGDAATQLGRIAGGLADRLTAAADGFDRLEAGPRGPR